MPRDDRLEVESKEGTKERKPKADAGATKEKATRRAPRREKKAPQPPEKYVPRLRTKYKQEVVPALMAELKMKNPMQVPRLEKVVLNMGLGEATQNPKAIESATKDLAAISGQHPVVTKAKKSIASFKLRTGMPIGAVVTLRGQRMYEFLDKLVNVTLPRIRDFQGVPVSSFDGRGNYSIGIKEHIIFLEIDYSQVDRIRGLQVILVTSARRDEEAKRLLQLLGVPIVG